MRRSIFTICMVVAVSGCPFLVNDTCACTPVPPSAVVFGTVSSAAGTPSAGTNVVIYWRDNQCVTSIDTWSRITDGAGNYRAEFSLPPRDSICVRVRAGGYDVLADTVLSAPHKLGRTSTTRDSVRIDLVLP